MQPSGPDAALAAIAHSSNEMSQGWMRLLSTAPAASGSWLEQLQAHATRASALHAEYVEKQARLWNGLVSGRPEAVIEPEPADRRFASPQWRDQGYFDYLKQSYLLAARYVEALVASAELQPDARERALFAARQWIDALCPANFAATNPQVLREALDTQGQSIGRGLANLIGDVQKGRLSQTDEAAFEVGRNLATTPGEVIYEDELIQLIQYRARTDEVAARPLVMVPPCINKFYILDLQTESSFVRYAVEAGYTVFMVSWRNVGPEQARLGWDDYVGRVLRALAVAREVSTADRVNVLGFCVGGTILGAALGVLAHRGEEVVASATFLASMLDFSDTGQIGYFIDEASVRAREHTIGQGGVFPGAELAFVFSSLRPNDLVWPYVVNNYLLGGRPAAFDLLFWNADSTNLPGPMYCYYVRNMYLENRLREPGALASCGAPIDLGRIRVPVFVLATREDHIVPWRSAYRTVNLVGGEATFVLGASGHIAGVVNPAGKNRRSHWTAPAREADPDAWLAAAEEKKGSWWPRWLAWLSAHGGGTRRAPGACGNVQYKAIEPAPGRYVRHRIH